MMRGDCDTSTARPIRREDLAAGGRAFATLAVLSMVLLCGACGADAQRSEEPAPAAPLDSAAQQQINQQMLAAIEELREELRELKERDSLPAPAGSDVVKVPYSLWHGISQPFELGCWTMFFENEVKAYAEESEWMMRRFNFEKQAFKNQTVVDIGCGPTGRLTWLEGSFIAIEPLAGHYRQMPWAHLEKYHKIYEQPAEIPIAELVGAVDMIFAINSLDHAFDLEAILGNMFSYLKPGGRAFISVDVDKPIANDPTHPLRLHSETVRLLLLKHGFVIEKEESGKCNAAGESSWGGGTAYHWWLQRPATASP
jgi:SAM-dependent methyltransferase